jgi:hypothetical protein
MWKIYPLLIDGKMKEHPTWKGYFITEDGEVYSYWRRGKCPVIDYNEPPRKLSLQIDRNGYQSVTIGGRKGKRLLVHRLVAETHLSITNSAGLQVNHKDYNRTNNKVLNLEWVSISENHKHSYQKQGRMWGNKYQSRMVSN